MIHRFVDLETGIVAYHRRFSNGTQYQQIWQVPMAGGSPVQVTSQTDDGTFDSDPDVSPDGARVAFLRDVGFSGASLWVANADGTDATQIDSTLGLTAPMWHPDGTKILYRAGSVFYTIEPDGSNKTDVSPDATPPSGTFQPKHPIWNSDGTKIGFHYDFTSGTVTDELWVCDADGSNAVKLSDASRGGLVGIALSWAHGSDVIAFVERISTVNHVSTINADGTGKTQLTNTGISPAPTKYAWAPDDSAIFVVQADASPWTMYTVDPSGGQSAVSPTLNGAGVVGQGQAWVYGERVYTIRSSDQALVSIATDGSDLRVEDTSNVAGPAFRFLSLSGNGTEL